MKTSYINLILKIVVAVILLQTLVFKFSGSEESIYIFTKLGAEPYGRIGSGIAELIISIFLFVDKTKLYAALLAFATMLVAVISHLTILGIEVLNDGGTLFILALIVLFSSGILIVQYKNDFKLKLI
ncbi:MAG: DoxX family membrane protein [Bacteroidota bacterium]